MKTIILAFTLFLALCGALAVDLVRNQSSAWAERVECHTDSECQQLGGDGGPQS
jgi:hypothetical protein